MLTIQAHIFYTVEVLKVVKNLFKEVEIFVI
jgi:hypothetical protein